MKLARTVLIGAFAAEASPNKCAADCKTDLKLSDKDCQTGCKNVRNDCPDGIYPVPGEVITNVYYIGSSCSLPVGTSNRKLVFSIKPTINLRSM